MKHLSEAVSTLLAKQDQSSKVAGPIYPAGHYQPYSPYHHHMPPYGYTPYPPQPPPPPLISLTQSFSSDSDLQMLTTNASPTESQLGIQLDSDIEEVPPLPPPLTILEEQKNEEEFADTRCPLQPIQAGGQKNKKSKKNKIVYPVTEVFNNTFLSTCLAESVSRPNFSLNLVNKFFTEEVRLTSNVSGKGKNQLDKDILSAIKVASFRMWPLKSTENEVAAWRDCIKAIDEGGRRLRKYRNKSIMEQVDVSTMKQADMSTMKQPDVSAMKQTDAAKEN